MQAPQAHTSTACMIVIGNEILSGRTQDKNLAWIASALSDIGIPLKQARVIPDDPQVIIDTVNELRQTHSYVFTSGGIGPTHDDITTECVAKALGAKVIRHPEAEAILIKHYGDQLNDARLKMADIPEGASLIDNPVSAAPGFRLENVFVLAGVPSIFQAMFASLKHELQGGEPIKSRTIAGFITEGTIATKLSAIQDKAPDIDIGSYPFVRQNKLGTSLVIRGTDTARLDAVREEIKALLLTVTDEIIDE